MVIIGLWDWVCSRLVPGCCHNRYFMWFGLQSPWCFCQLKTNVSLQEFSFIWQGTGGCLCGHFPAAAAVAAGEIVFLVAAAAAAAGEIVFLVAAAAAAAAAGDMVFLVAAAAAGDMVFLVAAAGEMVFQAS